MSRQAAVQGLISVLFVLCPQEATHKPFTPGDEASKYFEIITRLAQALSKPDVDPDTLIPLIPGKLRQTKDESRVFADRNVKTVLRIENSRNHNFVRDLEMHFEPSLKLQLKHLSQQWGSPASIAEGEECSVRWNINSETLVVYAQLLSRTPAPDSIVLSLEMRSIPTEH